MPPTTTRRRTTAEENGHTVEEPTTEPVEELPLPTNVIAALARVTAEIGGIAKTRRRLEPGEREGLKFPYRGIDAIASQAQPLLGKYGIVIVPTEAKIVNVENVTVGGNPWTDTLVTVLWTVYGPGGLDDSFESVTQGLGRDNSDKGYNKGATQAYKNLLLRLLCIGDPKDDADEPEHQDNVTSPPPVESAEEREAAKADTDALLEELKAAPEEVKLDLKKWANGRSFGGTELFKFDDWRADVRRKLSLLIEAAGAAVPAEPVLHGPLADALAETTAAADEENHDQASGSSE